MTSWCLEIFRKLVTMDVMYMDPGSKAGMWDPFKKPAITILLTLLLLFGQSSAANQQSNPATKKIVAQKTKARVPQKKNVTKNPPTQKASPPTKKKSLIPSSLKHLSKPAAITGMPHAPAFDPVTPTTQTSTTSMQEPLHKPEPFHDMPRHDDRQPGDDDDDDDDDGDDEDEQAPPPGKKIMIRVLLKEIPTNQKVTFTIQSSKGFVLESPIASGKRARWKHEILNLLANDGNLFLLTDPGIYKRIKTSEVTIASVDGELKIDNNRYRGTVYLRIDPETKNVQMVNKVDLDDYIYAVLRYESLSYWPLEMHKVQAIASRSYAVRQIKLTRSSTAGMPFYDIKNYNVHQVYNGDHDSFHLRKAVDATHNLVLTYKDNIALTMFDICCGGIIQSFMKKKDADKPYLFRKSKCTYCAGKANYEWKHAINKEKLLQNMLDKPKLASKAKKIGKITGISIKEKDRAGIVHRILIHGSKNNISFTNNEFKSALDGRAKSNAYSVKKLNDTITTHGYGFGHNMGLCQIGARELVSKGWDYQEILDFYFPKTKMMRLKVI